ncbi:hypothetical protein BJ165DRAFT_1467619 [Panaeolus papilionaceus]|nr:hypothetical protein BJ165DRAFT_1467619 [Panaeolus papilionaceus]
MKFSALVALPFFIALVAAEPIPEMREVVARGPTLSGTVVNASAVKCRTCPNTSCTAVRQYERGVVCHFALRLLM